MDRKDAFLTLAHVFILEQHVVLSVKTFGCDLLYFKYHMGPKLVLRDSMNDWLLYSHPQKT